MKRAYKFRIYPNELQQLALESMFQAHCVLYNEALHNRKEFYAKHKKGLSFIDQCKWLTVERNKGRFTSINSQSSQLILNRLDRAFLDFFRRIKLGQKPGYPRFKNSKHFESIPIKNLGNGVSLKEKKIYVHNLAPNCEPFLGGKVFLNKKKNNKFNFVRIKRHRPIEGITKNVILKKECGHYYVIIISEVQPTRLDCKSTEKVGLDKGLTHFYTLSDGTKEENPKFYQSSQKELRILQRSLSRKKKGSKSRSKQKHRLAKFHQKIFRKRRDHQFKTARKLTHQYGLIAIEKLNVTGMMRRNHHLAKSISDVSWYGFDSVLKHKAEEAGALVIEVDPKNTSQLCSSCGQIVKKDLSVRVHNCQYCGLRMDRDQNAALNILKRALDPQAWIGPAEPKQSDVRIVAQKNSSKLVA